MVSQKSLDTQDALIDQAVSLLQHGKLVAIPTETVYGLAADARNEAAIQKIFLAKGRPADHPLIVHLAKANALTEWAIDIPDAAWTLAETFWPGPLTLILKKAKHVSTYITGGQDTVGLRIPRHPLTLALLKKFGGAVCAPSANRFGHVSPTTPAHVRAELGDRVDLILEGGPCDIGIESTILDLSHSTPTLLRPGHIQIAELETVLKRPILREKQTFSPRVSGSLASHYAPRTPTHWIEHTQLHTLEQSQETIGLLCLQTCVPKNKNIIVRCLSNNPTQYAHDLYAQLHAFDQLNLAQIYIEKIPQDAAWSAVYDRLARATT